MYINGFQLLIYKDMQKSLCLLIPPDQIHQSPTLYRNGTFGRGLRKLETFQFLPTILRGISSVLKGEKSGN